MSYCPIYKDECPEDSKKCTFWEVKKFPSAKTKVCRGCHAVDWGECDYCPHIIPEREIEGCTLKRRLKE